MATTKKIRRFVEFLSPNVFVAESSMREVDSIDPKAVEWPANAYAFTMHEQEIIVDSGKEYVGELKQIGPTYFHPDSVVEDIETVALTRPKERILIANMRCNGWQKIVWSRWGTWPQPFDDQTCEVLK
jgi:hypothetical protein